MIPKRFNEVKDNKFSFVHIDLDLYEPTKESLNFFGEKSSKEELFFSTIMEV